MSRFARAEVRALRPYTLDLSPCRFKLDQNEVPWELPRRIKEEVAHRLIARDWARYPDFHAERLRQRLAQAHGWSAEGVLVGNGSNELLAATLAAVGGPGREILGLPPKLLKSVGNGLCRRPMPAAGIRRDDQNLWCGRRHL